jgi:hypothetical protein
MGKASSGVFGTRRAVFRARRVASTEIAFVDFPLRSNLNCGERTGANALQATDALPPVKKYGSVLVIQRAGRTGRLAGGLLAMPADRRSVGARNSVIGDLHAGFKRVELAGVLERANQFTYPAVDT